MRRRPIVNPQAAVAQAVADLQNKFEYPDLDTQPLPALVGGGGGAPTVVVAASDASDLSKSKADFVCPGVNDEETIQAALNFMDTGTGLGGRLLLTEGTFMCAANILRISDVSAQAPTWIEGMGFSTRIQLTTAGVGIDVNADGAGIRNLRMLGEFSADNAISLTNGTGQVILANLWLSDFNDSAIVTGSGIAELFIGYCYVDTALNGIELGANHDQVFIIGNQIVSDDDAILMGGTSYTEIIIANNTLEPGQHGVHFNAVTGSGIVVANNAIRPTNKGIYLNLGEVDAIIEGNTISDSDNGIEIDGQLGQVVVSDNMLIECDQHGIYVNDSSDLSILDNYIYRPGQQTDNTYDGIHLAGDSDRNFITGNKIVGNSASPQPRYGINVSAATCDDNGVVGNDFSDPGGTDYGTGKLNDAGTGTITVWSSGGPNGDNIN